MCLALLSCEKGVFSTVILFMTMVATCCNFFVGGSETSLTFCSILLRLLVVLFLLLARSVEGLDLQLPCDVFLRRSHVLHVIASSSSSSASGTTCPHAPSNLV